jgi:hypothetical protein
MRFMFMSRFRHLQQKCECERGEHVSVTTDKQLDKLEMRDEREERREKPQNQPYFNGTGSGLKNRNR